MFADIVITIPTEAIHAVAWFAIGSATMLTGIFALEMRARKQALKSKI